VGNFKPASAAPIAPSVALEGSKSARAVVWKKSGNVPFCFYEFPLLRNHPAQPAQREMPGRKCDFSGFKLNFGPLSPIETGSFPISS
jgi:hypothetical protein